MRRKMRQGEGERKEERQRSEGSEVGGKSKISDIFQCSRVVCVFQLINF
jgi:hypothetical protein